jgi:hypothetical protein
VKTAPAPSAAPPAPAGKKARAMPTARKPEDLAASPYADVLWALVSSSEFGTNH